MSDFDWRDDAGIVLREQPATAVYRNTTGGIVIRQECAWDEEEDPFLVFQPENLPVLIRALQALAPGGTTPHPKQITDQRKGRQLTLENV
jgi:hypothetical protein